MGDNGLIHSVPTYPYRFRIDYAIKGDDCDLCSAPTYVNYHGPTGLFHREPSTNSGSHRFFDQAYFAGAGTGCRFANGAALYLGRFTRYTHQYARTRRKETIFMHFVNKMLQHFFSHLEIRYYSIFERPDSHYIAWRSTQHALSIRTHSGYGLLAVVSSNSDHRRLIQNNALVTYINEGVCRP